MEKTGADAATAASRLVPPDRLAAECLALERLEAAKELHVRALRSEKPEAWHELRIGVKRFRYTVESLLPARYEEWGEDLKRVQDLLGEVHDLDVLSARLEKWKANWTNRELRGASELRLSGMSGLRITGGWRSAKADCGSTGDADCRKATGWWRRRWRACGQRLERWK